MGFAGDGSENAEVEDDHNGDKSQSTIRNLPCVIRYVLQGFVNQLGDVTHRAMHGKIFQPAVNYKPENKAEDAKENAEEQKLVTVNAEELDRGQIGKLRLASPPAPP